MADQNDVRRIALELPGTIEASPKFAFSVANNKGKEKGFVWVWQERVHPRKPRVPQPAVIAARVANETEKSALLSADPEAFFTEPHYNGFPAVLVRLPKIGEAALRQVVIEAWRCMAPPALVAAYESGTAAPAASATRSAARAKTARRAAKTARPATKTARRAAKTARPIRKSASR